MEQRKTVIVVGAGASAEFGLPTGADLTKLIQVDLNIHTDGIGRLRLNSANQVLCKAIEQRFEEFDHEARNISVIAQQISKNMPLAPSIDNFLDTHRSNDELVAIGKLAIAFAITRAEQKSALRIDESNVNNRLDFTTEEAFGGHDSWANLLFKILVAKRDYEKFLEALEKVVFISFNYDRCIKQFFVNAAASYFGLRDGQISEVLNSIQVVHPYGSLGELSAASVRTSGYGREPMASEILESAKNIRTFTEGVDDLKTSSEIENSFNGSELVIFLGFSFVDINMEILAASDCNASRVLATSYGRSKDTKSKLAHQLAQMYAAQKNIKQVEMFDGKCFELFYEFDKYLSEVLSA